MLCSQFRPKCHFPVKKICKKCACCMVLVSKDGCPETKHKMSVFFEEHGKTEPWILNDPYQMNGMLNIFGTLGNSLDEELYI